MSPKPALGRRSNGSIECAAFPAKNARARSVEKTRRASASALDNASRSARSDAPAPSSRARRSGARGSSGNGPSRSGSTERQPSASGPTSRRYAAPSAPSEAAVSLDAAHEERRLVVVERMRHARRRLEPVHVELERLEADGRPPERMDRRAHVVPEPGQRQLVGAHAAADPVGRLVHDHVEAGAGERDRRGEPVRPRTDDDRLTGRRAPRAHARRRAGTRAPPPPRCSTPRAASRRGSGRAAVQAAAPAAARRAPPRRAGPTGARRGRRRRRRTAPREVLTR